MKIEEAIKELEEIVQLVEFPSDLDRLNAVNLAIGALKLIRHARKWNYPAVKNKIPGES